MAVTFRDRVDIERGSIGDDGRLTDFEAVARNVRAFVWHSLDKRIAVEGEVFVVSAQALTDPAVDVLRRDVVVFDGQRYEVMAVWKGRNLRALHKFNHLILRESDA